MEKIMTKSDLKYPESDMIVCWLKNPSDLSILLNEGWYRIPVKTKLKNIFNVKYLSFYQPWTFKNDEKYIIKHFGTIDNIKVVKRKYLFPKEPMNLKSENEYYKIEMENINALVNPIPSKRGRRLIFINTTLDKFIRAREINDLFHCSPLEDKLWAELKKNDIDSERQFIFGSNRNNYKLDFVSFCKNGNLNIECDGDTYHANKEKAILDNKRDNYLTKKGWSILRYSTGQLENTGACLVEISETIYMKGGLISKRKEQKFIVSEQSPYKYQLNLF